MRRRGADEGQAVPAGATCDANRTREEAVRDDAEECRVTVLYIHAPGSNWNARVAMTCTWTDRGSPLRTANSLKPLLRRFGNIAASQELGVLEFAEISSIAEALIVQAAETEAGGG